MLWLIILASALGGGILLLHGFAKSKGASELMLDTYQQMLDLAADGKRSDKTGSTHDPTS